MFEHDFVWTSAGSSGGLTALEVPFGAVESALYCNHSTLASTQSFFVQTAPESTGPWVTEGSTAISTAVAAQVVVRWTGPYRFVRPRLGAASTGTYRFRLFAVR